MTSKKVAELNSVLLADFHKLLKKYQAVRKIVRILTVSNQYLLIHYLKSENKREHLASLKSVTESFENLTKYH